VLEVSLRKAGFSVTPAVSVGDALDKLEVSAPDLIISETKFATELDGFELRRRLRASPDWAEIPFIFLTAETAIENKIKGLELGVDDYLTKPIYIKEIVTRINILLQKRQRQFLDLKKDGTRFAGRVADMPVVDVIQTIEVSRKSGVIQFSGGPNRQAAIYFRDGKVIDAEAGTLQGEDAVYRLLTWNDGEFEVEFRTVRRREAITTSSQGLLMEGMRRLDEWSRLLEQLPPLSHRFEIDAAELSIRLGEVPDDNNRILRLFDGKRTLLEVIDSSDFGDLECLQAISRLYFEGMLIDLDPDAPKQRDTGKPMPLVMVEDSGPHAQHVTPHAPPPANTPTPIEQVASGRIDISNLEARASAPFLSSGAPDIQVPPPLGMSGPIMANLAAMDSQPQPTRAPSEPPVRESGEIISDREVVSEEPLSEEEPLPGPLMGGYRPSSLRLIDEAVAAAQAIEPSLFTEEELVAAGVTPKPAAVEPSETPIARVQLAQRASDPRIDNARDLIEKTPALREEPAASPTNGSSPPRRKSGTLPPPIPKAALQKAPDEVPLLDADLITSGEIRVPSEAELADVPLLEADPYVSGEHKLPPPPPKKVEVASQFTSGETEDYSGVPTVIEAEGSDGELADEGPTDPSRRRFASTIRRDDSQGLRIIGSHGRDRAEASGELKPVAPKAAGEPAEPQRELVTIMPRRITREVPQISDGKPAEAASTTKPAGDATAANGTQTKQPDAKGTPAVEPPARPPPPPRRSVAGGVVKAPAGPGRGAAILLTIASVLVGATVFSYCHKKKPASQPQVAIREDAAPAIIEEPQDAPQYAGFGTDAATTVVSATPDARVRTRPDAAVQVVEQRPDAAVQVAQRPDAAVQVVTAPLDAAAVSVTPTDAAVDKSKEAKALYDKGHQALEDGDPAAARELLEKSLEMRKTPRTYLEMARALQRLQNIDEALAAVDDAIKMNGSYAPAYEQKGMMLWSAQRYSDARPVLEKYLELDPTGKKADTIRSMLEENK